MGVAKNMILSNGVLFSIAVIAIIVLASVFLLIQYMKFMSHYHKKYKYNTPIIVEKHFNNNFRKNKNREIIIDIDVQEIKEVKNKKYLLGSNSNDTA